MDSLKKEELNQLISRTDMSGAQKVEWLCEFIDSSFEVKDRKSKHDESLMETIVSILNIRGSISLEGYGVDNNDILVVVRRLAGSDVQKRSLVLANSEQPPIPSMALAYTLTELKNSL